MSPRNPLLAETLRGLTAPGGARNVWLGYLAVQGIVLFLWWPKSEIFKVLASANPPSPLFATVAALGLALAYYSLRAGAEEILLPGQHPLGEWVLDSEVPLGRVLGGYLAGHLLQSLHLATLAAPFALAAFTVGGGTWEALGWSLATVLAQAAAYRLAGALVWFTLGGRKEVAAFSLRALLLLGYAVPAMTLPVASHLQISHHLFNDNSMPTTIAALPDPLTFVLIHVAATMAMGAALYGLLARHRRRANTRGDERGG